MPDDYTKRYNKDVPNRTMYVQRLKKPFGYPAGHSGNLLENVFSFGGGLQNGGLSKDAMNLLQEAFRFDYMGSTEYEWGGVPSALSTMAKNAKKLVAHTFEIDLANVPESKWSKKSDVKGEGTCTIYLIAQKADVQEFVSRIKHWASEGYNRDLKETTHLSSTLRPQSEWDGEVVGWLELNNGFMFFTDQDMFAKTATLFGVDTAGIE